MRRSDIKVGQDAWHRISGGAVGKYLGVVESIGLSVVTLRNDAGERVLATPAEMTQIKAAES